MVKRVHEVRDPIHVFIRLDSDERRALDSRPFQRLRYIHQLAMTYLVYPGATHRRFEHCLGVMDLAERVFNVVTASGNIHPAIRDLPDFLPDDDGLRYWRRVIRMAALCHDVGHLPFSHAAEHELLPDGWDHERLTHALIISDEMQAIWKAMKPAPQAEDIAKLAVGSKSLKKILGEIPYSDWEEVLSQIIVGNAFGVDRMDYLLRDSYHAGVAYGRFDQHRLIDTLRILPKGESTDGSSTATLGIEYGGLHAAEALSLARFFMFTQLYFHPVRRIYDTHLKDFLAAWLPAGKFSVELEDHLCMTDNEVLVALGEAARTSVAPGHEAARRILERKHFRLLYQFTPSDRKVNLEATDEIFAAVCDKFGAPAVRRDSYLQSNAPLDFPVRMDDGTLESCLELSTTLNDVPGANVDYIFISPDNRTEAQAWLRKERKTIITPKGEARS